LNGSLQKNTYTKVIPHGEIDGIHWTAIQIATASSAASVADLCLQGKISKTGFVRQEEIDFQAFIASWDSLMEQTSSASLFSPAFLGVCS